MTLSVLFVLSNFRKFSEMFPACVMSTSNAGFGAGSVQCTGYMQPLLAV